MAKQKKSKPALATGSDLDRIAATLPSTNWPDASGQNPNPELGHKLLDTGASGQMAVMSEFLYRQINVAVPEVDIGDDVFVVKERDEAVTRVQVKHSKADAQKNGSYVAQFSLPWDQFDRPADLPALVYVLAIRFQDRWTDFVVIRRSVLRQLQADHDVGTVNKDKNTGDAVALVLRLVLTDTDVTAKSGYSLRNYRNAFDPWPPPQLTAGDASLRAEAHLAASVRVDASKNAGSAGADS